MAAEGGRARLAKRPEVIEHDREHRDDVSRMECLS